MKKIYVAHQIGSCPVSNISKLRKTIRYLNLKYPAKEYTFFAPYVIDVMALEDADPSERARGIANDSALIKSGCFDEIWLTGPNLSKGMKAEAKLFKSLGKPVVDYVGILNFD